MTRVLIVQHGQKERSAGDPGLTRRGRRQAAAVAAHLSAAGITAVYSSPQLRARQTVEPLVEALGLPVILDDRLRERANWDGSISIERFLAEWGRATVDRDFVPHGGRCSRRTGEDFAEFLDSLEEEGPVVVASHGGATVDLLRTLAGDGAVPSSLKTEGVPPGAITTVSAGQVVEIADVSHLGAGGLGPQTVTPADVA